MLSESKINFIKNEFCLTHGISLIVYSVLIPFIGCLCLHFGVGGLIREIKLGIVNSEVSSIEECFNQSLVTFEVQGFQCTPHKLSCRFIDEFDNGIAEKVSSLLLRKNPDFMLSFIFCRFILKLLTMLIKQPKQETS